MRILSIAAILMLFSCKAPQELATVDEVDLEKYMGTWYEIVRLPNNFEDGLDCVTANYALMDNGKVSVLNKGRKYTKDNSFKDAKGTAKIPDPNKPGVLKVTFFWPFYGDYYIIELDENYQYALVGAPNREYLWVLSRTPQLSEDILNQLLDTAKSKGFPIDEVVRVNQDCHY